MNKKNYKSKRPSRRASKSFQKTTQMEKSSTLDEVKESANDWHWYVANDQLAKDVASMSFNTATGAPFTLRAQAAGVTASNLVKRIPGIMALYTVPSIGVSIDGTSPVNIASKNFYSFIRHANSGHSNYDSPDLMMYLLAMDSLFAWYADLTRVYGIARLYSQINRYYGTAVIQALGYNSGEVYAHLNDIRAFINILGVKMSSFVVPNTMSYYARHSWMYGNLYKDGDTNKAQLYAYVPQAFYKYVETDGAGRLVLIDVHGTKLTDNGLLPRSGLTYQDIINVTEELFQPLIQSEDIAIMSGDIKKAYGESVYTFNMIPEDYTVYPIYDEEILAQIHNTNFAGAYMLDSSDGTVYGYGTMDVRQDTTVLTGGRIVCNPMFKGYGAVCYDKILDLRQSDVPPEWVLTSTRNMIIGVCNGGANGAITSITACGSDIVLYPVVFNLTDNGSVTGTFYQHIATPGSQEIADFSYFDQAPLLYLTNSAASSTQTRSTLLDVIGDIENYTVLNPQDLYDLHSSALLSMFAVQKMGTAQK